MSGCVGLSAGMLLTEACPDCGHAVGSHMWPEGICVSCHDVLPLVTLVKDLEKRVERLERRG